MVEAPDRLWIWFADREMAQPLHIRQWQSTPFGDGVEYVRAALSTAGAAEPAWQPIETAPKDGTEFIDYGCYHYPDDKRPTEYVLIVSYSGNEKWPWLDADGENGPNVYTHWQPLPQPPLPASPQGVR